MYWYQIEIGTPATALASHIRARYLACTASGSPVGRLH